MNDPKLIPEPQSLKRMPGVYEWTARTPIVLAPESLQEDLFAAALLQNAFGGKNPILKATPDEHIPGAIHFRYVEKSERLGPQGYLLVIEPKGITLSASTAQGIFYGVQTLIQLVNQFGKRLPGLSIRDFPDFPVRGVYHDVCRGRVPKLQTLLHLVEELASYKINMLQLYVEHTFSFRKHPKIGRGASALLPEDMLRLDEHCRKYHIELVPSLQSFGHMSKITKWKEYRHLAEDDGQLKYHPEAEMARRRRLRGWTLSPAVPQVYDFLDELYAEFLPLFSSTRFNVCCDETWDLGWGKSYEIAKRRGLGRVYLDHILKIRRLAAKYGKTIMFWGDIILKYPELIPKIPKDTILLNWGYEKEHNFSTCAAFKKAGVQYYVCPGTSSWNSIFPRMDNACANILRFARAGKRFSASGLLNTDWGNGGHYNLLSFSWHGLLYGAEKAWKVAAKDDSFDERFGLQFFGDPSGRVGKAVRRLGNTNLDIGLPRRNVSVLMYIYFEPFAQGEWQYKASVRNLKKVLRSAQKAREVFDVTKPSSRARRQDLAECIFAADTTMHTAKKALLAKRLRRTAKIDRGIKDEISALRRELKHLRRRFQELWFARNRRSEISITLKKIDRALVSLAKYRH